MVPKRSRVMDKGPPIVCSGLVSISPTIPVQFPSGKLSPYWWSLWSFIRNLQQKPTKVSRPYGFLYGSTTYVTFVHAFSSSAMSGMYP